MFRKLLLTVAATGFIVPSALAADLEPTPAAYDWSGFYIGAQAGYGWGDSKHFAGDSESDDYDIDGFVGGGTAGYNYQLDQIVFGLEADFSFADIEGEEDASSATWACGGDCFTEVQWFGTVRGRLGFAVDNFLPFVTGGYAYGKAKAGFEPDGPEGSDTLDGYTIGGGLEYGISESLSLKVEYLYIHLGDFVFEDNVNGDEKSKANFNVVRGGVNWRF